MIKDSYEKFQKKYGLPSFDSMNNDFHIGAIEKDTQLLDEIGQKIADKVEYGLDVLRVILQPDANSCSDMYECTIFENGERKTAFALFKQLMILKRGLAEAELLGEEKIIAEIIKQAHTALTSIKPELVRIVKKMQDSWRKNLDQESDVHYLG